MRSRYQHIFSVVLSLFLCLSSSFTPIGAEGEEVPENTAEPVTKIVQEEEPVTEEIPEEISAEEESLPEEVSEENEQETVPEETPAEEPVTEPEAADTEETDAEEAVQEEPVQEETEDTELYGTEEINAEPAEYDITAETTPYHNYVNIKLEASKAYNNLYVLWTKSEDFGGISSFTSQNDIEEMGIQRMSLSFGIYLNSSTGKYSGEGVWAGSEGLTPNTSYYIQIVTGKQVYEEDTYIYGYEPLSSEYSFTTKASVPETSSDSFEYEQYGDTVTIKRYIGSDAEVTIPSMINGACVNTISSYAFQNNTRITKVVIPSTVTSFSTGVFNGCTNLETLVIPNSITNFWQSAIEGCTKLKIAGPVGSNANLQIDYRDHTITGTYTNLMTYVEELIVPDDVTVIGNGNQLFYNNTTLKKITLGNGVKTINNNAFSYLTALETVDFGTSLETIGNSAFSGTGLSGTITLPASVKTIGNKAFRDTSITEIRFLGDAPQVPAGYTGGSVSQDAFVNPETVKLIFSDNTSGWTAGVWNGYFARSASDTSTPVDEGVAGDNIIWKLNGTDNDLTLSLTGSGETFDYYHNWTGSDDQTTAPWGKYSSRITKIIVGEGVSRLGNYAFYKLGKVTDVTLPETLTVISDYVFYDCDGLTDLPLPVSIQKIGSYTFAGNDNIAGRVKFPDTLNYIGEHAFEYCKGLTGNLVIPDSVTYLGYGAFSGCTGFHGTLTLSANLDAIQSYAFSNCKFTGTLTIPEGVTEIGYQAFYSCEGFTGDLILPDSIEKIGEGAFEHCYGMTGTLKLPAALTTLEKNAFAYHCFTGNLIIPEGVQTIPEYAFRSYRYDSYEDKKSGFDGQLILPEGLTSIGNYAFWGNSFSGELSIPAGVTKIGNYAFTGARFSGALELPPQLKTIGDHAFDNTRFDDNTFIPASVISIGAGAFANTPALVHFTLAGEDPTVVAADNTGASFDAKDILYYDPNAGGSYTTPKWNGYTAYPLGTVTVESVKITAEDNILLNGKALQLHASVIPANAVNKTLTWSIDTSQGNYYANYFMVDQTGLVTTTFESQGIARAIVMATSEDGGYTDKFRVYAYNGKIVRVSGASFKKSQHRMIPGSSYQLNMYFTPANASIKDVIWTSSDPSVVSIGYNSTQGMDYYGTTINALKPGTAVITGVSGDGGYTSECLITVLDQASGVILDYSDLTMNQGETFKLSGYVVGEEEEDSSLTWYSTDTNVAAVDSNGNITAVNGGTADIIARSSDGGSAQCHVTVLVPIRGISLDMTSLTLSEGDSAKLNAVITPYNTTDTEIVWNSDNALVVTVDQGLVTALQPGSATVTVSTADGSIKAECQITVRGSEVPAEDIPEEGIPAGIWVSGIEDKTYTGAAQKQDIRVYDGNVLLTLNKDYKVSYKNNKNAGTASVIITMKGNYAGTVTETFEVLPLSLTEASVSADDIYLLTTGAVQKKVPVVTNGKTKLRNGRDFTLSYDENSDFTEAGDHYITVKGIGNYTDEIVVTEHISDASNIMISKASVNKIGTQIYTGSEIEPAVTVKYKKAVLTEGTDYEVSYANNTSVGKGTVIITGLGEYTGIKKVTFTISGVPMKKVTLSGLITTAEYTGEEILQDEAELMYGDLLLTEGEDYTVSYTKNVNAGTAKVTFKGMGGFTGSVTRSFKITKTSIEDTDVEDRDNISVPYVKGGAKPKPVITWNGTELQEGKDYTMKYAGNKAVTGTTAATITVTGKGNFSGKITLPFEITPKDLSQTAISVKDKVYTARANAFKSSVTVLDTDGKKLKAGTDYNTPEYSWKSSTAPSSGTTILVKITGKGNYTGSITASYRIIDKLYDISKAGVTVQPKTYTGKAVTLDPNAGDLQVQLNGQSLVYGQDYEITGYTKNISQGTATVTLRGIGQYGGVKTVKFRISQKRAGQ